ncbi:isocitrate lyase/phosphoenolpyruvate mutase family protein [Saccharothrix xinjiangensis]|uniref:Isocitrate lyase/phosphoenolpyruvate mutase family protein n=1 Tax=Saccharothrix xinjiangensis TaxID=204798 RepID=A0ABV9Y424_9PSEU
MTDQNGARLLRGLHVPGDPVVLPNVWDAASARVLAEAGYPAVATASAAVSATLGYGDGHGMPVDEAFAAIRRVAAAVDVPVTADVERGYGLPPALVAERLAEAGAVGCNLEDSDPATGRLVDLAEQVDFLAAVRAADPDLVVNARVDVFVRGAGNPDEEAFDDAVRRGRAYLEAGADCVYPITMPAGRLAAFVREVGGPVNHLHVPGSPTPAEAAALGVARVSFGPGLQRLLMARLGELVADLRAGRGPYAG